MGEVDSLVSLSRGDIEPSVLGASSWSSSRIRDLVLRSIFHRYRRFGNEHGMEAFDDEECSKIGIIIVYERNATNHDSTWLAHSILPQVIDQKNLFGTVQPNHAAPSSTAMQ